MERLTTAKEQEFFKQLDLLNARLLKAERRFLKNYKTFMSALCDNLNTTFIEIELNKSQIDYLHAFIELKEFTSIKFTKAHYNMGVSYENTINK